MFSAILSVLSILGLILWPIVVFLMVSEHFRLVVVSWLRRTNAPFYYDLLETRARRIRGSKTAVASRQVRRKVARAVAWSQLRRAE